MTRRQLLLGAAAAATPAFGSPSTGMGIATTSLMTARRPHDTYDFLEYCHSLGAGGIQASFASLDPEYLKKLRARAEQLGMYIEVMAELPKRDDAGAFEDTIRAAKATGALCVRCAALGGRRYENFSEWPAWQAFVTQSKAAIDRALAIATREQLPLAIENHKDWTAGELAAIMKDKSSEYLGVCLDTGNNISLLDNPMDAIETLLPYALSTHFKDMAVEPYTDGFLLSEVPLGEGIIDLKRAVSAVRRARPKTRFTLEMITRNPLQVPCLTDKYWVTFPERNGRYLADALRLVRNATTRLQHLPTVDHESRAGLLQLEEENIKQCLHYARTELGL
ncbi:MAG: sugar phosphate isomerase/epimerase [Acidobacteriia bacterium]|nr:sugar phosphate isomerase/epimerase [Terriglobia bacterium]